MWPPDVPGDAGAGAPWQLYFARCGEVGEGSPTGLPRSVEARGENVRSERELEGGLPPALYPALCLLL